MLKCDGINQTERKPINKSQDSFKLTSPGKDSQLLDIMDERRTLIWGPSMERFLSCPPCAPVIRHIHLIVIIVTTTLQQNLQFLEHTTVINFIVFLTNCFKSLSKNIAYFCPGAYQ